MDAPSQPDKPKRKRIRNPKGLFKKPRRRPIKTEDVLANAQRGGIRFEVGSDSMLVIHRPLSGQWTIEHIDAVVDRLDACVKLLKADPDLMQPREQGVDYSDMCFGGNTNERWQWLNNKINQMVELLTNQTLAKRGLPPLNEQELEAVHSFGKPWRPSKNDPIEHAQPSAG